MSHSELLSVLAAAASQHPLAAANRRAAEEALQNWQIAPGFYSALIVSCVHLSKNILKTSVSCISMKAFFFLCALAIRDKFEINSLLIF